MPLRFSTRADTPPNLCMECGEVCRKPKRFCSDDHKELWLREHKKITPEELARARRNITPAIEWRQKLSLSRPF